MEFSPQHRKTSDRANCCFSSCTSKKSVNRNLSFHRVPKYGAAKLCRKNLFGNTEIVDKRREWLRILKVPENYKHLFVCSLHFNADDYHFPDVHAKVRILKKNSVPMSVNTPKLKNQINADRKKRMEQKQLKKNSKNFNNKQKAKKKEVNDKSSTNEIEKYLYLNIADSSSSKMEQEHNSILQHHDADCDIYSDILYQQSEESNVIEESVTFSSDNIIKSMENAIVIECKSGVVTSNNEVKSQGNIEKKYEDKSTQVSSGDFSFSCSSFIKSKENLISMCNIKSFAILDELTKLIDETFPQKKKKLLSTRDSIILTTAKLKLDIPFKALGVLFSLISEVTIRNVFYDTVKKLAAVLQSTISRVSKEEILRNMPKCFSKFRATTSVFDCTEIKIQKPKCLKCRLKLYSHYKGDFTVKFMTEVSPAGIITCVSEAFGGRASDKSIFNQSGILQHLESTRDAVMVDKGFLIDEECMQRRIQLIRPPFLRNREQLSEEEALQNREIASARVHIERMNQRIKLFLLLNNKVPWYFINYIDDIFIVCCGLANLGTPILADDKF